MSGDDLDLNAAEKILQPRRRPAQQRSRAKYSRILAAARSVLVDMGFESFTFDEVAKRAEVPICKLFQFLYIGTPTSNQKILCNVMKNVVPR